MSAAYMALIISQVYLAPNLSPGRRLMAAITYLVLAVVFAALSGDKL